MFIVKLLYTNYLKLHLKSSLLFRMTYPLSTTSFIDLYRTFKTDFFIILLENTQKH